MKLKTNLKLKCNIIDPVPVVNVMILLVLFFVLGACFMGKPGIVLSLPRVEQTDLYQADSMAVTIAGDGKVFLAGKEISGREFQKALVDKRPQLLIIRAGGGLPHGQVTRIIGWARNAGIERIPIAAEAEE